MDGHHDSSIRLTTISEYQSNQNWCVQENSGLKWIW